MKLLAVISHKGGGGKTTSAVLLAEELAERGYRVLLIDSDRQHSAGLLLDLASSEERIQETRVSNLDYFASGRLGELDVEERYAELVGNYDIGVVDTPSLDDALARAWLSESDAALVVLQVEPLTMKTMHAAMATIETVRRMNPRIQVLGLLPTMYDETQETHRTLLTELTSRRRDSVFSAIPTDPGLMHRAGMAWAAEVGAAARDAYWSATDRIVATLNLNNAAPAETQAAPAPGFAVQAADRSFATASGQPLPAAAPPPQPVVREVQSEIRSPKSEIQERQSEIVYPAPRRSWAPAFAPFALGFAAALLVLALVFGPLRNQLRGTPARAAVPAAPTGGQAPSQDVEPKKPAVAPAATPKKQKKTTAAPGEVDQEKREKAVAAALRSLEEAGQ